MPIRPRTAALGACACLVLLALVWFTAFHIGFFSRADQSIYVQFGALQQHGLIKWVTDHLVSLFNPDPYVYLVVAVIVVALLRGRPWSAVAVAAIVLGANASTELLKHLPSGWMLHSGVSDPPGAWPSGHSTAAMSLVLAIVIVSPARIRPAVTALGAPFATAVGYSVIATGMHHPSDVLGGFLVAASWALATVAVLLGAEGWRPSSGRASPGRVSVRAALGAPGAVLVAAVVLAIAVLISRPHDVVSYAHTHEAFVIGAIGLAALGLALSTGVLLSVRRLR